MTHNVNHNLNNKEEVPHSPSKGMVTEQRDVNDYNVSNSSIEHATSEEQKHTRNHKFE